MIRVFQFISMLLVVLMVGCHKQEAAPDNKIKKSDLTKAASFNLQLGLGYLKQGDRPRAKKKLLLALEQEPNSAGTNAAMAFYYEQTNELEDAKKYYLKAISLSNNAGAQLNNYGAFLCRQGEYNKAEAYFLKAIKDSQYVHTSGAYENAGLCALAIPDNEKAKHYFITALNQDPSRRESLYELVKLESKQGKNTEALNYLQKHPDIVLNDRILLSLAQDVAQKAGNSNVSAEYGEYLRKIEIKNDSSGVNNEYNNHSG